MLRNPFTPTTIASQPGNFVGRRDELLTLERSLVQGSVAIQGPVGIGKSSLLGRGLLSMEGLERIAVREPSLLSVIATPIQSTKSPSYCFTRSWKSTSG